MLGAVLIWRLLVLLAAVPWSSGQRLQTMQPLSQPALGDGDTLESIAKRYHTSVQGLGAWQKAQDEKLAEIKKLKKQLAQDRPTPVPTTAAPAPTACANPGDLKCLIASLKERLYSLKDATFAPTAMLTAHPTPIATQRPTPFPTREPTESPFVTVKVYQAYLPHLRAVFYVEVRAVFYVCFHDCY